MPSVGIKALINDGTTTKFGIKVGIDRYIESLKEFINLVNSKVNLKRIIVAGEAELLLKEILFYLRVEFNQLEDNDSIDGE